MTPEQLIAIFREAARSNDVNSAYTIAAQLGAVGFNQEDELANELALWAISFVGALSERG